MKKLLSVLVIGSFCVFVLFLGCDSFTPPGVHDSPYSTDSTDETDLNSTDWERKDALALKHLQIPHVSEDILASYVMDFIKNVSAVPEAGTERNVQPAPAIVITKSTEIIHVVETGFAETTADKRSARSLIGPGRIPFYVFTLENQETGKTGFAFACGDNRIGNILAVAEEGSYDDGNPFLNVFFSRLAGYIENTIATYNSVTEADIQNALNKINENARATAPDLPVTDVGKLGELIREGDEILLETARWHQNDPYNKIINDVRTLPKGYENDYTYVTGCVPTAIAIIMAYHSNKRNDAGMAAPYTRSQAPGYENIVYNWRDMINDNDDKAVAVLMYEIGLQVKADYSWGPIENDVDPLKKKEGASTSTSRDNPKIAYSNMGYRDPGNYKKYETSGIKTSIKKEEPVQVAGNSTIWGGVKDIMTTI